MIFLKYRNFGEFSVISKVFLLEFHVLPQGQSRYCLHIRYQRTARISRIIP